MPSRFIHSLTNGKIFFFIWLIWSNIPLFHYLYIPHFLIPFIHWQIVRGFHMLATVNNTILNMVVQAPLGDSDSASSSRGILDHTKGEGDARGWDGWMASLTRWTWVWLNSGSWWWTGRPGVLRFMGSQRVGHDWATELNWTESTEIETWKNRNDQQICVCFLKMNKIGKPLVRLRKNIVLFIYDSNKIIN